SVVRRGGRDELSDALAPVGRAYRYLGPAAPLLEPPDLVPRRGAEGVVSRADGARRPRGGGGGNRPPRLGRAWYGPGRRRVDARASRWGLDPRAFDGAGPHDVVRVRCPAHPGGIRLLPDHSPSAEPIRIAG